MPLAFTVSMLRTNVSRFHPISSRKRKRLISNTISSARMPPTDGYGQTTKADDQNMLDGGPAGDGLRFRLAGRCQPERVESSEIVDQFAGSGTPACTAQNFHGTNHNRRPVCTGQCPSA